MKITRENLPKIVEALADAITAYQRDAAVEAAKAGVPLWSYERAVESARQHAINRLADALGLEEEE